MRAFILLSAVVFLAAPADARPDKKGKGDRIKQDNVLVAELQFTFKVIDNADPIYHGHRRLAREEINAAIGELQKEMKKRGLKQHHLDDGVTLPRSVSHARMLEAADEIRSIQKQIAALPTTAHRTAASKHLVKALKEIDAAIDSVKKKKK